MRYRVLIFRVTCFPPWVASPYMLAVVDCCIRRERRPFLKISGPWSNAAFFVGHV